jgi:hypothetical protein
MQHGFYLTAAAQEVTTDDLTLIGVEEPALTEVCRTLPEQVEEAEQVLGQK